MQRVTPDRPAGLTVLYDQSCGVCCRAKRWLAGQATYVPLDFVGSGSAEARARFPGIGPEVSRQELTVIDDRGNYWAGAEAWVMCLWALYDFRSLALEFSEPGKLGRARQFVQFVGRYRHQASAFLRLNAEEDQ